MSDATVSTNEQIDHTDSTKAGETKEERLNDIADDMAGKAGRVQSKHESSVNDGAVSPGGGGIFSK